jgi:hypothetical protein
MKISEKVTRENTILAIKILAIESHNNPFLLDFPEVQHPNELTRWTTIGKSTLIEIRTFEFNQIRHYIYANNKLRLIATFNIP